MTTHSHASEPGRASSGVDDPGPSELAGLAGCAPPLAGHLTVYRGPLAAAEAVGSTAPASVRVLDRYQRELDDGPTLRAARTCTVVGMGLDELDDAWPTLAAAAATAGIRSVHAVPVPLPEANGALTLYRHDDQPLDPVTLALLTLCAEATARAAAAEATAVSATVLSGQLRQALDGRAVIDQAKGILMAIHRVDADAAFALLRTQSQNTNTRVHDVATAFVAATCAALTADGTAGVQSGASEDLGR